MLITPFFFLFLNLKFQDWFNLNVNTSTDQLKEIHKKCKHLLSSGLPYEESLCCEVSIMQGERAQVFYLTSTLARDLCEEQRSKNEFVGFKSTAYFLYPKGDLHFFTPLRIFSHT